MGACKAPIPHLLITSSSSSSTQPPNLKALIPISRTPLPTRRLVLLSLPLATFLLPSKSTAIDAIDSSSSSSSSSFNPISEAERDASTAISERISEALALLEKGRELQARGDFDQALLCFTQVIEKYKEFAFSDYARVGRALTLYEVGNRDQAISEMEDVSISLKGYPEVHAALAAALYVDKHSPLLAENQFTIATLLDPHYTDLSYVKDTKHWPPSLDSNIFAILMIGDYLLSFICIFSFLLYYLNGSSVPMVVVTSLLAFTVLRFISTIVRVFWSAMNKNVKKLKGGQTLMGLIHYH